MAEVSRDASTPPESPPFCGFERRRGLPASPERAHTALSEDSPSAAVREEEPEKIAAFFRRCHNLVMASRGSEY